MLATLATPPATPSATARHQERRLIQPASDIGLQHARHVAARLGDHLDPLGTDGHLHRPGNRSADQHVDPQFGQTGRTGLELLDLERNVLAAALGAALDLDNEQGCGYVEHRTHPALPMGYCDLHFTKTCRKCRAKDTKPALIVKSGLGGLTEATPGTRIAQNDCLPIRARWYNARLRNKAQEGGVQMNQDSPLQREATILDSVNEGVFTVDPDWRITAFNRAAELITGVSRDQAIGSRCCDVFRADVCEKNCALRQTMQSGKSISNVTAHIVNQHGHRIPIRISTALLKDSSGTVVGGVETFQDLTQIVELQKELTARYTFEDIVGHSPAMMRLFEVLPQIAASSSTVLIEGPSGTGKELFARAIHNLSPRKKKPFIAVNCAALPDTLLESELFGHKAGAFTDAKRDKPGRFALADGGTIFLDEIGDVSPAMQVRLLRVLQERVIEPLGDVKSTAVDVRVIVATNKDLAKLVQAGQFRDDLYYRIRVVYLALPSLRQRREDIPLLIDHLVARFNRLQGKHIAGISDEVLVCLMEHDWPGNVRELENVIEQAFVLCRGGRIELQHLPPELRPKTGRSLENDQPMSLAAFERLFITETLQHRKGNRKLAARDLGLNVSTLYRKIKTFGIETPDVDGRSRRR